MRILCRLLSPVIFFVSFPATATELTTIGNRSIELGGLVAADLFGLADQALQNGRSEEARTILEALLSDLNSDVRHEAGFRLAKLDASASRDREAATRLRVILDERPDAQAVRLELAALLAKMGDTAGARREIRFARAGELPPEVAQMVDRFSQALRSSRPFGGSLQLGTTNDSNINRATRSDTLGTVIGDFTLDEEAKQTSGRGASADAQIFGRVEIGNQSLVVTGSSAADLYRHKRFNDVTLALHAGPELNLGSIGLTVTGGISRRWLGMERFTDVVSAQTILISRLGPTTQARIGLTAANIDNHRNQLESGQSYSAALELEKALSSRTGIALSFAAVRQDLHDPGYSTLSGQLSALAYRTFGRMTLTGAAAIGRLIADERLALYPNRRSEWSRRLTIGATFRKLELMGFSPTAQIGLERNSSSIEIYDYRRRVFEMGIARAF